MRLDLIQQVLITHEIDMACRRAFGCSAEELRERAPIVGALINWAAAIKVSHEMPKVMPSSTHAKGDWVVIRGARVPAGAEIDYVTGKP